jgi:thiol-disulfide isomerase/thioredoxin
MIPDFDLSNQNSEFSSTSVLGKPSVMTFISSWEPQSSDQLLELDQFKSENDGVNVAAVVTQESVSKVDIFKKVGGYKIPIIADPDGILVVPLNLESLPTHIFLDRKGMIKDMYVGFLNKDSLLKRILN